jgi:hypothetical protein
MGQFVCNIAARGQCVRGGFIVVSGKAECLMSYRTANELGIICLAKGSASS